MASEFVRALENIHEDLKEINGRLTDHGEAIICLQTKVKFAKWIIVAVPTTVGAIIGSVVAVLSIAG